MKFGIIGSGVVGQTLGTGLIGLGHEVMIGSREANNPKLQEWLAKNGEKAREGTFAETAAFGDIVILATLWSGTENALRLADPKNLEGKVLIDATNPLAFGPSGPGLAVGFNTSGGEQIQGWASGARVVKAFNIVTAPLMINASALGETPDMFIAGNDAEAKKTVTEILEAFGWPVIDVGGIEESRLIEPLGMLWVKYYFQTKSPNHAFKLIRK